MDKPNLAIAYAMKKKAKKVSPSEEMDSGYETPPMESPVHPNEDDADMITRIMHKRKMMAEGGLVADETPPSADDASADFDYLSEGDLDDSSTNSGASDGDELGDHQEDEDRSDIVSRIMKQRKMKNTNPRPA